MPPPTRDRWGTRWRDYRVQAASTQFNYYQGHICYGGSPRLFGLSVAEVPDLAAVPITQTYQPFGVGGVIAPNDGAAMLGHVVIVPHYVSMLASLSPTQSSALWDWLESEVLFTPLNNAESLMMIDASACTQITWNALKGSWNLNLQTLGWGRLLAGSDRPLCQAVWANDLLRQRYVTLLARVYLPMIMKG